MRNAPKDPFKKILTTLATGAAAMTITTAAHATTTFNAALASPGFYNGSGNPNAGFTVNTENGIELGLGVNYRFVGPVTPDLVPNPSNVYHVNPGFSTGASCANVCSLWNFEFSVNLGTSGKHLSDINTQLTIQNATNLQKIVFDPKPIADNASYDGTNTHSSGGAHSTDVGFQNSENLSFLTPLLTPPFNWDPTADNTFIITLALLNETGAPIQSVSETVVVGAGAAPLPAALPLFASGAAVLGFFARRRKNNKKAVGALA